jgi:hypothetical protein
MPSATIPATRFTLPPHAFAVGDAFWNAPPPSPNGIYLANATSDGTFSWIQAGGLGSCGPSESTLPYGSNQTIDGWTVKADQSGTTFINQSSGYGMFVSIESTHQITP